MDLKYNKTSIKQINIISLKFNLINSYIKQIIKTNDIKSTIKIMDIGCSHGLNSIIQASSIIGTIRDDMKYNQLIEVYNSDQEINNFTELFQCVNNNDESYHKKWDNIYSYAIGKNFMNQLTPSNSIDIIFSYFTLHWSDRNSSIHSYNKDLYFTSRLSNKSIEQYSSERLNQILSIRYQELKRDGLLIFNLVSTDCDVVLTRFEESFKNFKQIFRDMANEMILTHDEVDDMKFPILIFKSGQVKNIIQNIGFNILEFEQQMFDWGMGDEIQDEDERAIQFVDSVLSFCGPMMKISIKGNQDRSNRIYNQFVNRFYIQFKSNPSLYKFKVDTLFIILKK